MNQVEIKVTIMRANPHQCSIQITREGSGDDVVEDRADRVEAAVRKGIKELGGEWKELS